MNIITELKNLIFTGIKLVDDNIGMTQKSYRKS